MSTRTHIALFVKSIRADGKSTNYYGNYIPDDIQALPFGYHVPKSTLKLERILLLKNDDLENINYLNNSTPIV